MTLGTPGIRAGGLLATLSIAAGMLAVTASPALADTCPKVNPTTHAVSPHPAEGVNWNGCDLTGANLHGANLNSASLAGTKLNGADLSSADLDDATLTGAMMANVNLLSAVLVGAHLQGVSSGGDTGKSEASCPLGPRGRLPRRPWRQPRGREPGYDQPKRP